MSGVISLQKYNTFRKKTRNYSIATTYKITFSEMGDAGTV